MTIGCGEGRASLLLLAWLTSATAAWPFVVGRRGGGGQELL